MHGRWRYLAVIGLAALLGACGGTSSGAPRPTGSDGVINGAGATFPYPIYSKWFSEYARLNPAVQINYQSIGSGGGIRQLMNQTVFFGATDGPMTDEQLQQARGPILHLPTVLGAVVPTYNVPGLTADLRFTGEVLADILMGKVTKWNAPALQSLNPNVTLPSLDITVVHRSDGSGTTFILLDYLAKVSPELKQSIGVNTSVSWPVGIGAKGNEGVAGLVSQTPGALGYVELVYALQTKAAFGAVKNLGGEFIKASVDSVTRAAAEATTGMPGDFRVSITNTTGSGVYPISSFTWLLLEEQPADTTKAKAMVEFLKWALTDGQTFATELGYARLPPSLVELELQALNRINTR